MACVIGPSVTTSSTDFSFLPKPSFFGIYLNFQPQKSLLNQYIPHSEIQILPNNSIKILLIKIFPTTPKANSIKSSSRSFQQHQRQTPSNPDHQDLSNNTKGKFQFLRNFELRFDLIFSVEIIQYLRTFALQVQNTHGTKPMHPFSFRAFQRDQECDLKHPSSMDLISTKQNKQTTLLHR